MISFYFGQQQIQLLKQCQLPLFLGHPMVALCIPAGCYQAATATVYCYMVCFTSYLVMLGVKQQLQQLLNMQQRSASRQRCKQLHSPEATALAQSAVLCGLSLPGNFWSILEILLNATDNRYCSNSSCCTATVGWQAASVGHAWQACEMLAAQRHIFQQCL